MLERMSNWSAARKIAVSFAFVIFVGSLLLTLPISQTATSNATYFDNLFTAVSMVCVTGLFIESVHDSYTVFGQIVCMVLMQTGGLGLMTIIASVISSMGQRLSLKNRLAVQEGISQNEGHTLKDYLFGIMKYTAVIQVIAIAILSIRFVPMLGWAKGLFTSLFLTVSGFNNAGFDNLGNVSMIEYVTDPIVNLVLASLIILGGIGFSVWFDVTRRVKAVIRTKQMVTPIAFFRELTLHTRIALIMTALLLVLGTIVFVIGEYTNEATIAGFSLPDKFLAGYFQTTTMRTAGFATIDYTLARPFTIFYFVLTMFVGGSPGGTAGGLKTTTFAMLLLVVYNGIRGQKNMNIMWRTISADLIRRATIVFLAFTATFLIGTSLLMILNPTVNPLFIMFEAISALATVGVSANLTPNLEMASHVVLMLLMFIGRIGPITMVDSLVRKDDKEKDIKYVQGNVLIG